MKLSPRYLPVLVFAAMMSAIISSLGMLLVPTIASHYEVELAGAQWTLTINLLVGAVATPIMGRISDGRAKKMLLVSSLGVVTLGSILAAIAPTFVALLIGRGLQGLAYGVVPVTISLARNLLPADRVQSGISILSVTVATGLGLGYPLTGLIADTLGFRWAFGFGALFAFTAMAFVQVSLPADDAGRCAVWQFDWLGACLLGGGLAALLLVISEGPNWGLHSLPTVLTFLVATLLLWAWARQELRVRLPLVNIRAFRRKEVVIANATALGMGASMYIALSIISVLVQSPEVSGYGFGLPLALAGVIMVPLSIGSLGVNRTLHLIRRWASTRSILVMGASLVALSAWILWGAHSELWQILSGMFIIGAGIGMAYAAMPVLIQKNVAAAGLGSAVSFNQVLRTVGGSVGSAVAGAVLTQYKTDSAFPLGNGIDGALLISALGCSAITVILLLFGMRASRR